MGSSSITQTDDVRVVVTAVHDTREMDQQLRDVLG
jgi:hypothetical protein